MRGLIGGISVILLAVAAQAKSYEQDDNNLWHRPGATVMGGPLGNDGDGGFISPYLANIKTNSQVNEWKKNDHSVHLKYSEVDPRPIKVPVRFGSPGTDGPRVSGPCCFERRGAPGVTAIGGPSGDDGENFNTPFTSHTATEISEHNEDDHSIGLNHENIYHPAPFRASTLSRRSEALGDPSPAGPPVKHFAPRPANHFASHSEPHPEPHYEPHPEPHFVNHPESHYDSHYSPSYESHYEPHSELENDLVTVKDVNNAPAAGSISFGRRPTK